MPQSKDDEPLPCNRRYRSQVCGVVMEVKAGPQDLRTVTIVRADDGSVGLRFLRPDDATAGPFEVTGLVPNSPAERSGAVKKGDLLCEVDGRDVSTLDDNSVANLFRGAPASPFKLRIGSKPPCPSLSVPAMTDNDVEAAIAWAGRNGRLPNQHTPDFEALLRVLQPVSLHPAQVSEGTVIGQGANGSVFRAEMQGTAVAVKRVNPATRKPLPQLFREMLLETTITIEVSRNRHPHIVTFLGAAAHFPTAKDSQSDWSIGLVFELCDPYDLYHLLHNHKIKLNLHQKLRLVRESAAGLAYIHSLDIIHRDFGSRNILIKDQHAKITDFGIARKLPSGHTQYQPSSISGTLQWMAPEQISGKMLSPQSDVFALGTVLWEILTETVPFSDVQDPLKPDMPAMRSALNIRDMSVGGWPFGPSPIPARDSNHVSITLKLPRTSCVEGLPVAVKRDLDRLLLLLHHHLPAFRPTAEEAAEVIKHLEEGTDQDSSAHRVDWLKTIWRANTPALEILMGLEQRVAMSEKVARFYEKHDKSQLSSLEDAMRWDSIFQDSKAWESEMMISYKATTRLATSSVSRLMARRQRMVAECSAIVRVLDSPKDASRQAGQTRNVFAQLLRGVTGVASWLVDSVYSNLGLWKLSWRFSDSGNSPGTDPIGHGLPVRSLPYKSATSKTNDVNLDDASSGIRSQRGCLNA